MSISSYSELQTAVTNWTARADLATRSPEFITLAEAEFNRELRVLQMEVVNQNFPIGGEYMPVPSGFLAVRDIYLNTSPRRALTVMGDDVQTTLYASGTGIPKYYSIAGMNFRFSPIPAGTYSATLRYYQTISPLAANTTNWLLASYPDVYLFGALMQASAFVMDDQATAKWASGYERALKSLKDSDSRNKWGGSGMAVRVAGTVA